MLEKFKQLISNIHDSVEDVATRALLSYEVTEEEYDQGLLDGTLKDGAYQFPSVNYLSDDLTPNGYPIMPYTGYVERDDAIWVGCSYSGSNTSGDPTKYYIGKITQDPVTGISKYEKVPAGNVGSTDPGIGMFGRIRKNMISDANGYIYMIGYSGSDNAQHVLVIDLDNNISSLTLPFQDSHNADTKYTFWNTDNRDIYYQGGQHESFKNYYPNITDDGGVWMASYCSNQFYLKDGVLQETVDISPRGPVGSTMTENLIQIFGNRLYLVSNYGDILYCDIDGSHGTLTNISSLFETSTLYNDGNMSSWRTFKGNNCIYLYCQVKTSSTVEGARGMIKIPINGDQPSFIPGYTQKVASSGMGLGIINTEDNIIWNNYGDRDSAATGGSNPSNGFISVLDKNTDTIEFVQFHQQYTNNKAGFLYQTEDGRIIALQPSATSSDTNFYNLYELDPINKTLTLLYNNSISVGPIHPTINDFDNELFVSELVYNSGTNISNLIRIKDGVATKISNIDNSSGYNDPLLIYSGVVKTSNNILVMDTYTYSLLSYGYVEHPNRPSYYILNEDNTLTPQSISEKPWNSPSYNKVIGSWFYHRKTLKLKQGTLTGVSLVGNNSSGGSISYLRNKSLDTVNVTANSIVAGGKEMIRKQ